jgi:hypothetical protein
MGMVMPGPKLDNILTAYVDTVPILPSDVVSGKQASRYFEEKHKFTEVSLFTKEKMERKIDEVTTNSVEKNYLTHLSNLLNLHLQQQYNLSKVKKIAPVEAEEPE